MKKPTTIMLIVLLNASIANAACGPPTYSGCTSAQLRQIQAGQFNARRSTPLKEAQEYWRDRKYVDRKDSEDRNERRETRELEAKTRRYEAKQKKEADRRRKADVIIYNGPRQLTYWQQKRLDERNASAEKSTRTRTTVKKSSSTRRSVGRAN